MWNSIHSAPSIQSLARLSPYHFLRASRKATRSRCRLLTLPPKRVLRSDGWRKSECSIHLIACPYTYSMTPFRQTAGKKFEYLYTQCQAIYARTVAPLQGPYVPSCILLLLLTFAPIRHPFCQDRELNFSFAGRETATITCFNCRHTARMSSPYFPFFAPLSASPLHPKKSMVASESESTRWNMCISRYPNFRSFRSRFIAHSLFHRTHRLLDGSVPTPARAHSILPPRYSLRRSRLSCLPILLGSTLSDSLPSPLRAEEEMENRPMD